MNKTKIFALATIVLAALALTVYYSDFSAKGETSVDQNWQFTITGFVEQPQNLTVTDLMGMPQTSELATIYCVDFPNSPVSSGNWTGVKLSHLLNIANVSEEAVKVAFYASDGFSTDLTLQRAMQDDIIIAYQKDGSPLAEGLRLVVPGHWGYKWIAKLTAIELVDYNYLGFWESRGYSDEAYAVPTASGNQPNARIPVLPSSTPSSTLTPTSSPSPPTPTATVSPSTTPTQTPSQTPATPTSPATLAPKPTQTSPAETPTPTASPSAIPITSAEPEASTDKPATTAILPIAEALTAIIAAVLIAVLVVVLRKKRIQNS